MSVLLRMYGNHHLKFHTYESGMTEVEQALGIKIHRHSEGVRLQESSGDFEQLQLIEWPHFSNGQTDYNSIWLRINFDQCEGLRIFKHGFDLILINNINLRYHTWKTLVSKGFLADPEMKEHVNNWNSHYADWIKLKTFAEHVSKKLQGTQFVYVNDFNFQDFGPELESGMTFEKALEINKAVSEPLDYNELLHTGDQHNDLKDWYIEQLDVISEPIVAGGIPAPKRSKGL